MYSVIGFDTSNYTTSAAVFCSDGTGANESKLLSVKEGALGLRQSEALFQHVRALPDRVAVLKQKGYLNNIKAVGASSAPREVEGSYMPCFLAGVSQGKTLADVLNVPFYSFSHQQGHVAAACWSADRMDLLDKSFLSWHLSGGTTELLYVDSVDGVPHMRLIGGTNDISAGQLIDRTGQMLGIPFPSGKALDALASESTASDYFPVKIKDFSFSLSGVENQVMKRVEAGMPKQDVARYALLTIVNAVDKVTKHALDLYPGADVLLSGGVASNMLMRKIIERGIFAHPMYSTDNAMGIALLTMRALERGY